MTKEALKEYFSQKSKNELVSVAVKLLGEKVTMAVKLDEIEDVLNDRNIGDTTKLMNIYEILKGV